MKNDAKTAETIPPVSAALRSPRHAVWIHANDNFSDSVTVSACDVLRLSGDGKMALIRYRGGCAYRDLWVPVASLASDTEKALVKLPALVSDLFARPPSITLAGKTAGRSETPSFLAPSLSGGEAIVMTEAVTA
ncbi:MAG: hypothetical protein LBK99_10620 [Opitutaceae bacterium]|jgi:hypothetical protein|nr:hypothetical protein [Opitutaceae bacterium]